MSCPFDLGKFVAQPSTKDLEECNLRKDDWLGLAKHYKIKVRSCWKKARVVEEVVSQLVDSEVLDESALELCESSEVESLALRKLELDFEREKLKAEKEMREAERKERESERKFQLELLQRKTELGVAVNEDSIGEEKFDFAKNSKLVPEFDETDPDEFFLHFEKVALSRKWPKECWPALMQSALKGKGRSTYLSLTLEQSSDYDILKEAVSKAYKLTTEHYRFNFRQMKKGDSQTYVEYVHSLNKMFCKWLSSAKANSFEKLKEMIMLEQFLRSIPLEIKMYLMEREVNNVEKAAYLADDYSLIHNVKSKKFNSWKTATSESPSHFGRSMGTPIAGGLEAKAPRSPNASVVCYGCNQKGHVISRCPSKNVKTSKSNLSNVICFGCKEFGHVISKCPNVGKQDGNKGVVNLVEGRSVSEPVVCHSGESVDPQSNLKPFQFEGLISAADSSSTEVPIRIMRDTAASQSVVVRDALPNLEDLLTGESVILSGIGGTVVDPLCRLYLKSDLVTGYVTLAVEDSLNVKDVQILLGNDIAGSRVVPDPIVRFEPLEKSSTADLDLERPNLFPSCVVTRSAARIKSSEDSGVGYSDSNSRSRSTEAELESSKDNLSEVLGNVDLHNLFDDGRKDLVPVSHVSVGASAVSPLVDCISDPIVTHEDLVSEQRNDSRLGPIFDIAVSESDVKNHTVCYYVKDSLLMRKFLPFNLSSNATWAEVHQVVLPSKLRQQVLHLAHDLGGHLGIKKTERKILKHFYWPQLHKDVSAYCRDCHTCQLSGKPNQRIKPAPLQPIPVLHEPFAKVLIDCVGPLPKTRRGHQYLLTIMCSSTRYPEAIPLRNISSKLVVGELVKFFTKFGIPSIVQSDQGSNFTSGVFQQAMNILGVKQQLSTPYHPESQGALERFHQTLKSTLTKYCLETANDWDDGVPLVLFAIRDSCQESLGFSPNELLFGREVRGPLKLFFDCLVQRDGNVQISEYVQHLKGKLEEARKFALHSLMKSQCKMKVNFDKTSKEREFSIGDKVLLFLPLKKSPLQCKFEGPYKIVEKRSDVNYVIETPGRRKNKRLVHVNLLKKYHEPVTDIEQDVRVSNVVEVVEDDFSPKQELKLSNSAILQNPSDRFNHLTPQQQVDVRALLEEFADLFSDVPRPTSVVSHDVVLQPGTVPIRQRPYRLPPYKQEAMRKEVEFLLENGLAEPSDSPWASPCILTPKQDKSFRMSTDFRKVNAVTIPDAYPIPRIDDLIDSIGTSTFVSTIDLLKGYYQIPLTDSARKISAFITPEGLFEYTVMPFGMTNAVATFQRLMNNLVSGLDGVNVYIDDIVVYSTCWREHLERLQKLFLRLREARLTINLAKSVFGKSDVTYLGHKIGHGMVAPKDVNVHAIQKLPVPSDRRAVQRFLGMAGYYRRFCPNFTQVVAPLINLTSPKVKFLWSNECQQAFEKVKAFLTSKPVLKVPEFDRPFSLQVDASNEAVGAVLLQPGVDSVLHPVSYFSKKLKSHQKSYSVIEKEALALLLALENFEVYVCSPSHAVTVYSDHNPLSFVNKMKNKNPRLTRWALALQPYNISIVHIKGKDNMIADLLSRS